MCGRTTPEVKFRKLTNGKYRAMCNPCAYERMTRPRAEKRLLALQAYKLEQGCVDCGYREHPEVLQFDHLPGEEKRFNIGDRVYNCSLETLMTEVAKCEVVCANCHIVRTSRRRKEHRAQRDAELFRA